MNQTWFHLSSCWSSDQPRRHKNNNVSLVQLLSATESSSEGCRSSSALFTPNSTAGFRKHQKSVWKLLSDVSNANSFTSEHQMREEVSHSGRWCFFFAQGEKKHSACLNIIYSLIQKLKATTITLRSKSFLFKISRYFFCKLIT